jgi:hypothetical protein
MAEEDGIIDQKTDTGWFTYLTTNARGLSTSWPKFADPNAYALDNDTLTGILYFTEILVRRILCCSRCLNNLLPINLPPYPPC